MFKMMSYDDVKDTNIMETINASDYSEYKDTYVKVLCVKRTNALKRHICD